MLTTHPLTVAMPVPVSVVPLQQNEYWPVLALDKTTLVETVSSCRQAVKTVTPKLQEAVLFEGSVAVQVTVVVPTGKGEPDGGTQTTVAEQLSEAVGAGKLITELVASGQVCAATTLTEAGQVIIGA